MHVAGCRHDVLYTRGHALERLILQIRNEDSMPVADDEECGAVVEGLAGVLVWLKSVALNALAVEAALRVDAAL